MTRVLLLAFLPVLASAADLTGQWNLRLFQFGDQSAGARIELKAEGSKVEGTLNELKLAGTIEGQSVHLVATRPNGSEWGKFEGRFDGTEIKGTVKRGDDDISWEASRAAVVKGEPKTHNFEPTKFQRQFSGTIEPVLHVNPGDTIRTKTVDAGGRDASGKSRSMGGNPETGPFYVEGAMPGDTLVVKFNRIRLNRDSAGTGDRIVPTALQPWYFRDAKFDDKFSTDWTLDRTANVAVMTKPTERLKNFKPTLRPMLGCVGVAPPAKQAYRSGWLGSWGGNMDYNGLREGVTVYLPVYQEGALLFVGDGHALEGDGELTGDALETSMDVEFTIGIVQGKSTQGPRFEDAEFIMASGIAGSLQEALQQATTELSRWLERDYKLSPNEAHAVLGTSIKYDIAEIVDPQVHIVAKVSKATLAMLN